MFFFRKKEEEEIGIRSLLSVFIVPVAVIFVVILIGGLCVNWKIPSSEALINVKNVKDPLQCDVKEHIINSGEVFARLNTALDLSDEQLQDLLEASKTVYDLTQIKTGNVIRSFFNPSNNEFQKLEYDIDKDNVLVIEKKDNGELKAEKRAIEYEIELIKVSGKVEETLYQTGKNLGLEDKTIMEMADVFAWDIDFGFDVKKGDEFGVLYEKRRLDGQEVAPGMVFIAYYQNQNEDHWAVYYKDFEGREDYYDLEGHCLRRQFLKAPINYRYISSGYSLKRYHPVWHTYTTHQAIDYAAACGTPVSASGAGTIIFAGWKNNVYGRTVEIRHNGVYTTRYAHLSGYAKGIKYGAKVNQGQIVGFVGTSGTSTGCHLDYAMMKYGSFVNPLTQNFERSSPVKDIYREDFNLHKELLLKVFNSK